MRKFVKHVRRWNIWRKKSLNGRGYKLFVLLGITKSPTFAWTMLPEEMKPFEEGIKAAIEDGTAKRNKEKFTMKHILIKYFNKDLPKIKHISQGDWVDLRAAKTIRMKKGDYALIPLGVGMILPEGYEAHVIPRSSTPSKFGIICANSMGVIDNSYQGDEDEWKFPAVAIADTTIHEGDRICQFRIVENQPKLNFIEVGRLLPKSRGGIGSTGTR